MTYDRLTIERIDAGTKPGTIEAALDLVLRGLPDEVRRGFRDGIRLASQQNPDALGELWRAVDPADGSLQGAVWAQLRPGGTAIVWPPQWKTAATTKQIDPLLRALMPVLSVRGTTLAQSLLVDRDSAEGAALESAGFRHLADLSYLAATVESADSQPTTAPHALEFAPITTANWSQLVGIVEQTYRETLDCPELNGVRATADVVDEYKTVGAAAEKLWALVRHAGNDVGCLLLADHPHQDQLEVVYMGLVPSARGHGWGEVIVRESLRMAQRCRRARVVLAVDAANSPAVAMYRRAGFSEFDRRAVMIFAPKVTAKKS